MRRVQSRSITAVLSLAAVSAGLCHLPLCFGARLTASISGTVTDANGIALAAVTVTVLNADTGRVQRAETGPKGLYCLPSLAIGAYEVRFLKAGFRSELRIGVTLAVAQQAVLNVRLQPGPLRQRVTVRGELPLVGLASAESGGLAPPREIKGLPLNGRSYDQLLTLNPGIVDYTSEKTGGVGVSNSAVANMFAVSGRRPQANLFLLDGIEYTGAAEINTTPGGTSGQLLGVEAVQEFKVLKDTYGAEYGKKPGAQVIIVTQSGSNQVHGSAYDFMRNSVFDARNFFDRSAIPRFERNQYGAALSGPLERKKLFLFGNYEGFRQRLGLSDLTLAPNSDAREGLLPGPSGSLVDVGIAPRVRPLLPLWPAPNGPELGGGIAESFSHPVQAIREDFGTSRGDDLWSDRDSLTGVYTVDDSADSTPTSNPESRDVESLREPVLSLAETRAFSAAWLNVVRFGFSRGSYFYTGVPPPKVPGFIAGDPVGAVVIGGSATPNSPSQITLAGSNIGSHLFAARNLFTAEDTVFHDAGISQWTAGLWFQRVEANDTLALGQYGQANFSSLTTFLQGQMATLSAVLDPTPLGWRSLEGAWFVEDALQLKPGLSLRIGFRDEFTNGWNEAHGRAANYAFNSEGVIESQPRIGDSALSTNNARFLPEPRAALAWAPLARERTVLRAGFGLYASLQDALSYRLDQNAPFNTTLTWVNIPLSALPVAAGKTPPAGARISPAGVQPSLDTPMIQSYTLAIDQEITSNAAVTLEYAGSRGYHEIVSVDANEPVRLVCPSPGCPAGLAPGVIFYPKGAPLADPALLNTWTWFSEGNSSYNALEADFRKRFSHGFALRAAYTWSKSLDDGDTLNGSAAANAPTTVMDPMNLRDDWGLATFDVRETGVLSGSWKLPYGNSRSFLSGLRTWQSKLASGWTLNGILTIESGFPFTPELGFNPSNNGDTRNPVRPSWNPDFRGPVILGRPREFYNPAAFVVPANGTYGNAGRDVLAGPGLKTADISVVKDARLSERLKLEFRAEFFNLFNTANFSTPNPVAFSSDSILPSSTAGVITGTSTASRQIQFALKLIW
ncbi:MAG: carboxypeptidase regulatory-like domain-containing protein [Terriglobia bacterium]